MTPGARRAGAAAALLALSIAAAGGARAQTPPVGGAPRAPEVIAEIVPVLGTSGSLPWGWNQILVRIQNNGTRPAKGVVDVSSRQYGDRGNFEASAPYAVGAGSAVHVRVPARVAAYADIDVRVQDDAEGQIAAQSFSSTAQGSVVLFDVSEASKLRGAIHETPVVPLHVPTGTMRGSTPPASRTTLLVGQPRFDPATGDPVLPDRAALYSAADAVLMRTDTLSRLGGAELDALAGHVLGGGTLALVVARPEDLRSPALVALVGGEVTKAAPAPETRRPLFPAATSSGAGKAIPPAADPAPQTAEALAGWTGGNLRPSLYGASAFYGLGEVHLLAFDPTRKPAVDDPWAQVRVADLARRGFDRRSTIAFRPGDEHMDSELNGVRRVLDPNESSRWAIGLSALLLCVYAVLAGPINFSLAARRGKPLRALRHLPIYAAIAFATIVGIGMAAKGVGGRARHLTLVEAGAGMTRGTARRFRGFFASRSRDLTVRTTDASSVLATAVLAELSSHRDRLIVDRDGARLVDVAALPWQTVVVREDGFASLGDGIAIAPEPAGDLAVANRTGRDLRAAVLFMPDGSARYFARIEHGERVVSSAGVDLSTTTEARTWLSMAGTGRRVGGIDVHDLYGQMLAPVVDGDAPGLGAAWAAIDDAASDGVDWLPAGVPVLLAQIDGGEGRRSDSGLRLESDRLLVRVVGHGGKP